MAYIKQTTVAYIKLESDFSCCVWPYVPANGFGHSVFSLLKMHSSVFGDQARLWVLHVASRCPPFITTSCLCKAIGGFWSSFLNIHTHPLCVFQVLLCYVHLTCGSSGNLGAPISSRVSLKACNSTIKRYRKSALKLASRSCIQFFRLS